HNYRLFPTRGARRTIFGAFDKFGKILKSRYVARLVGVTGHPQALFSLNLLETSRILVAHWNVHFAIYITNGLCDSGRKLLERDVRHCSALLKFEGECLLL